MSRPDETFPLLTALLWTVLLAGATPPGPAVGAEAASGGGGLRFLEQALPFEHRSGRADKPLLLETMGGGIACGDLDGDGLSDLVVTGGATSVDEPAPPDVVFFNEGERRFSAPATLPGPDAWSMGVSLADYDGDTDLDVYITAYGPNRLLRNDGDGRFTDVTESSGTNDPRWSMGSAWADDDGDGDLDLFVANYVDVKEAVAPPDKAAARWRNLEVAVGPAGMKGAGDALFRNEGDGTFRRAEGQAGVDDPGEGYGFQPLWTDMTGDGKADLLVANDSTPNLFYVQKKPGLYEEQGVRAGLAYSLDGQAQAGMGACLGDPDGDGDLDLVVTNFSNDYNTFYRNLGGGFYEDATRETGLRNPTWSMLSWACAFADLDGDGREELFIANGHLYPQVDEAEFNTRYRQRDQVFRFEKGRFREVDAGLEREDLSRGACLADLDADGRLDLAVATLDGAPVILWNETPDPPPVLRLRFAEPAGAPGAVLRAAGRTEISLAGEGFLGSFPYEEIVPVPRDRAGESFEVKVLWPSGREETFAAKPGETTLLTEGKGKAPADE